MQQASRKLFKISFLSLDMIELTFLGTSQAIPTRKRNHTAILLRYKDEMLLIDCGEGTQRQFRIANINPCKLTGLLITHWHGDHILGIPGLLQTLVLNGYNKTLHVYGPKGTRKFMQLILNMFIFVGKIKISVNELEEGIFLKKEDFSLEAINLKHSARCLAYSFLEAEKRKMDKEKLKKLGIKGKIIGELQKGKNIEYKGKIIKPEDVSFMKKGKKIAFILDTALCNGCYKAAKNADLLVAESTYSAELAKKAAEYKHLTAKQTAQIAKRSKVKQLILTHLSQRYEYKEKKILDEAKKIFSNTILARDFMNIKL